MLQIFIIIFYFKFPQNLYHYAHYYSQNLLIILIILNFTAIYFHNFSSPLHLKTAKYFVLAYTIE